MALDIPSIYSRWKSRSALKSMEKQVAAILAQEPRVKALTDSQLRAEFMELAGVPVEKRIVQGFALVREASQRVKGMRQFDVQLIGGLVLLQGKLAEMRTGEGKTLTVVAPTALLALDRKGVHVITANSYLAQRDAELMRPIYEFLGLTVCALHDELGPKDRKEAYLADITYGVGHDFGFDYLRDNLAYTTEQQVQRPFYAAIIDEIDSILIDEARTPMVMSGKAADVSLTVRLIDQAVKALKPSKDFIIEVKEQQASLTEAGYAKVEAALASTGLLAKGSDLYAEANLPIVRRIHSAVRAYALYRRDKDYVVENGEVMLVDAGTGRKMEGRRFEDGLHEALEAKEGLAILPGSITKATVTYQNFFCLYNRLAGLTGTALTDADEFAEIYNLEVVVIPTNRPSQRVTEPDLVFSKKSQKFDAVVNEVSERHAKQQPVLIGCASIRDAEVVSKLLTKQGIPHNVLTAKHLAREAEIIAQAGALGAVTVATNMAGRGTDIALGGEKPEDATEAQLAEWSINRQKVIDAGGLYVLGTERNGLRRVDNQLAGRCGRQGDPGCVQFMLSLEDELLKAFAEAKALEVARAAAEAEGRALTGTMVSKLVTKAQVRFENQGFDARKTLMKYDKVLSEQREAIYGMRQSLLDSGSLEYCKDLVFEALDDLIAEHMPAELMPEQWDMKAIKQVFVDYFGLTIPIVGWINKEELDAEAIHEKIRELVNSKWEETAPSEEGCKAILFRELDIQWTEHLTALEELRSAANLKAHTGLNPLYQFSKEGLEQFHTLVRALRHEVTKSILATARPAAEGLSQEALVQKLSPEAKVALALEKRWIRRTEQCPCGSGLRYKDCHGKLASSANNSTL